MHLQHDVVCPTLIGRDSQLASLGRVLARGFLRTAGRLLRGGALHSVRAAAGTTRVESEYLEVLAAVK